ncbi:hypothetical protein CW751_03245 [Brumimicrobium salinarum]|uniref:Uncharacterized protein n=1 Tax=Brumimicrobium salinarum TaxID=2058658 RepID=A0A2I0R4P7_9FLAO|nr:hypothetical protein [Brumimicrobium salinarum]PKR81553.1 hypothetical protein CW751_03245 [Brumimicrobium salinarum]
MTKLHQFHIPVMGIGYTLDTPIKVAQFGIDSVVSLVDDELMEKLRKVYCNKFQRNYIEISNKINDYRAKRITSFLNLLQDISEEKFNHLKKSSQGIKKYFRLLHGSQIDKPESAAIHQMHLGSIDVNIMTKLDKENYNHKKEVLPTTHNDAHAALRGFAKSKLNSSLILSAGMNPKLFSYFEDFEDFFPDKACNFNKKIIIKVSDYRSALIQGKFFAKKGLWVSEFRIESGLNCGGHAFSTNGMLLGPILAEFRDKKEDIFNELYPLFIKGLQLKNKNVPITKPTIRLSAQGGVGTAEEQEFLIQHYKIDSVGWGTPFLLVPQATTVDQKTIKKLITARESDLYLSNISPLGVPLNNLRGNSKDLEKKTNINNKRPGSSCPKKYLAQNKEFTNHNICTASRQYQHLKIQALQAEKLSTEIYQKRVKKITDKSCICVGLGTSTLLKHNLDTSREGRGVSICPGPNLAYFSKTMKLTNICDHIYHRDNVIERTDRPNMYIKELRLYLKDFKNKIQELEHNRSPKEEKQVKKYALNLLNSIKYYRDNFRELPNYFIAQKKQISKELQLTKNHIEALKIKAKL